MIGIIFLSIVGYFIIGFILFGFIAKFSDITMKELEKNKDVQGAAVIIMILWPLVVIFFLIMSLFELCKWSLKHIFKLSKDDGELKEKKETKEKTKKAKKVEKNSMNRHELLDFEE